MQLAGQLLLHILTFFATITRAQNLTLTQLIANRSDLAGLNAHLQLVPEYTDSLDLLTKVTVLAPSNEAWDTFLRTATGVAASIDASVFAAVFDYHTEVGVWYHSTSPGTGTPHFIHTTLTNSSYANVTGGQWIEGILDVTGAGLLYTGLGDASKIITGNLNFTGGVLHIIDSVLTIPETITTTSAIEGLTAAVGAFEAADVVEEVEWSRDITAFIPNNEAFAAVGSAIENISKDHLADIMRYHAVEGSFIFDIGAHGWLVGNSSGNVTGVSTLGGQNLIFTTANDGSIYVNSARVVAQNILVANGVMHVIDNVLNPANASSPNLNASTQAVAFEGASSIAGGAVPYTSGVVVPTAAPATPSSTTNTTSPATAGNSGLSTGAKAGIGVGVAVAAITILGLVVFAVLRKRKLSRKSEDTPDILKAELPDNEKKNPVPEFPPDSADLKSELGSESTRLELASDPARSELGSDPGSRMRLELDSGIPVRRVVHELDGSPVVLELDGTSPLRTNSRL